MGLERMAEGCADRCIAVGAAVSEVDWLRALSVSGVACVLSILTSLAGLPEVEGKPPEISQDIE